MKALIMLRTIAHAMLYALACIMAGIAAAGITALLTSTPARADTWLTLPGISYHADRSREWNETNPGVGIERSLSGNMSDTTSATAGQYLNSYNRTTFYAGGIWRPLQTRYVRAGLFAALATGYPSPIVVAPTLNIGTPDVSVDIIGAPSVGKGTTAFVALQLRIRIQ